MRPPLNLRALLRHAPAGAALHNRDHSLFLSGIAAGNPLRVDPASLQGARVLLRAPDQMAAALAMVALDGVAARMVIAPPDLKDEHLPHVIAQAGIDTVVGDAIPGLASVAISRDLKPILSSGAACETEWVLFTSGTSGPSKMVAHTLAALTGAIRPTTDQSPPRGEAAGGRDARSSACDAKGRGGEIIWGTFYDIRRYGGLQILLRALLARASLILSDDHEAVGDFLARLARGGVTHLTGTPSHWRRALMSPAINAIAPRYVRLSGEIADQAILDALARQFPNAAIGHAYASTEAGVGFEVVDGKAGFPAALIGQPGPVEMKVEDGTLRVRSNRTASSYVGSAEILMQDGFVDTGDMVALEGQRYHFAGRRGGIINVGGLKINPEEVEAVINRHPGVRAARVSGRKNPITGAIMVADVVLEDISRKTDMQVAILNACRDSLGAAKTPAMLRFVDRLDLTAAGKLARHG